MLTPMKGAKPKNNQPQTSERKEDGPFKVILTKMHYSADQEELSRELESMGHKVLKISVIKNTSEEPLPLFMIELERNDNNNEIFKIRRLWDMVVAFEPAHKKRILIQNLEFGESDDDFGEGRWSIYQPTESRQDRQLGRDLQPAPSFSSRPSSMGLPPPNISFDDNPPYPRRQRSPNATAMTPLTTSVDVNQNRFQSRMPRPPSDAPLNTIPTSSLNANHDCPHVRRTNPHGPQCSSPNQTSTQNTSSHPQSHAHSHSHTHSHPHPHPHTHYRGPRLSTSLAFNLIPHSSNLGVHRLQSRGPRLPNSLSVNVYPHSPHVTLSSSNYRLPRSTFRRGLPPLAGELPFPNVPHLPVFDSFASSSSDFGREIKNRLLNISLGTNRMEQMVEYLLNDLGALISRIGAILPNTDELNALSPSLGVNIRQVSSTITHAIEPTPSTSVDSEEPTTSNPPRTASNSLPAATNCAPTSSNSASAATNRAPTASNCAPTSSNSASAATNRAPTASNCVPTASNCAATASNCAPTAPNCAPTSSSAPTPSNSSATPSNSAPTPSNSSATPSNSAPTPSNSSATPSNSAPTPSNSSATPSNSVPTTSNSGPAAPSATESSSADSPDPNELGAVGPLDPAENA